MIDIRRVRTDREAVKAALARRRIDVSDVDQVAELDARLRDVVARRDELRARVNAISKEVAEAFRSGDAERGEKLRDESRTLGAEQDALAADAASLDEQVRSLLLVIPNIPADDAPDGAGEEDNVVVRVEGYDAHAYGDHQRVPHWDVGAALGILDLERGAKIAGSMFPMFRGLGATLVRALVQYGLDRNADAFEEIRPPTLVRTEMMVATGQLPKFADDAYHIERDDLWAIPTAEVPLTSIGRDEIIDEADLPVRLMAYTPCYRREAGAAGRDTRGMLRVHEFDKVEVLAYCTPAQAQDMHAELIARAEGALRDLGLAYRVIDICTGDLGQSHARCFDLEAYAPGVDQWLEVSSISWFSDYQARRANIRYRRADGGGVELVHTLNGSALATPRVWAAIVETYRQPDGSVAVPEVLQPYMRGATVIAAP
jgi:seryl-tRNA synthetase